MHAAGFTAITGAAFGPDRSMYVTQLTTDLEKLAPTGAVVKVAPDGTRTTLGAGEPALPAGAAVGRAVRAERSTLPARTPRRAPSGAPAGRW